MLEVLMLEGIGDGVEPVRVEWLPTEKEFASMSKLLRQWDVTEVEGLLDSMVGHLIV